MKELLKSVHICQSYRKNKSGTFLFSFGVVTIWIVKHRVYTSRLPSPVKHSCVIHIDFLININLLCTANLLFVYTFTTLTQAVETVLLDIKNYFSHRLLVSPDCPEDSFPAPSDISPKTFWDPKFELPALKSLTTWNVHMVHIVGWVASLCIFARK